MPSTQKTLILHQNLVQNKRFLRAGHILGPTFCGKSRKFARKLTKQSLYFAQKVQNVLFVQNFLTQLSLCVSCVNGFAQKLHFVIFVAQKFTFCEFLRALARPPLRVKFAAVVLVIFDKMAKTVALFYFFVKFLCVRKLDA